MRMDWAHLPPLVALRAFAVASRRLSFSAAARELNVTHAAVAQQVRALEEYLGTPLAHRAGRGIALTPEGMELARGLDEGFDRIGAAVAALRDARNDRPIRVTLTHAFARNWLVPRLGDFWEAHPDIAVSIHPDDGLVDLGTGAYDIAIRSGNGDVPGFDTELLVNAHYVIAGPPAVVGSGLSIDEMANMRWVLRERWPEQMTWLRGIGLDPDKLDVRYLDNSLLVEAAMEKGLGLMATIEPLIVASVARGIAAIAYRETAEGIGYHIVTRKGARTAALRSFIRWLKSAA